MNRRQVITNIKRWGRFALEAAPVLAMLNRRSHPVAWLAAVAHLADKAGRLSDKPAVASPSVWSFLTWEQVCGIIGLMVDLGIGEVVEVRPNGMVLRRVGGIIFGRQGDEFWGPTYDRDVDPQKAIDAIWERANALTISSQHRGKVSIQADGYRQAHSPSKRVEAIAADCAALRAAGKRVGVLLDGPPGSGKSQALLRIAAACGGRVLRASMHQTNAPDFAAMALVLRPHVVIFDDIDRGPTETLLDAIDLLLPVGVAILASSNAQDTICAAALREGRIDDHHRLDAIEPDVLARLADRLDDDERDLLAQRTVAAVMRYLEVKDTLGRERALRMLRVEAP